MSDLALPEIYALLRKAIAEAGGQSAFAELAGVTPACVSDVINARRDPGDKLLAALRVRKVTRYIAIGAAR